MICQALNTSIARESNQIESRSYKFKQQLSFYYTEFQYSYQEILAANVSRHVETRKWILYRLTALNFCHIYLPANERHVVCMYPTVVFTTDVCPNMCSTLLTRPTSWLLHLSFHRELFWSLLSFFSLAKCPFLIYKLGMWRRWDLRRVMFRRSLSVLWQSQNLSGRSGLNAAV